MLGQRSAQQSFSIVTDSITRQRQTNASQEKPVRSQICQRATFSLLYKRAAQKRAPLQSTTRPPGTAPATTSSPTPARLHSRPSTPARSPAGSLLSPLQTGRSEAGPAPVHRSPTGDHASHHERPHTSQAPLPSVHTSCRQPQERRPSRPVDLRRRQTPQARRRQSSPSASATRPVDRRRRQTPQARRRQSRLSASAQPERAAR